MKIKKTKRTRYGTKTVYSFIFLLAIILLSIVVEISIFGNSMDDAYISYRYAENLVDGKGLVFNDGERVEGYSNFLWVLFLSLAYKPGFFLPLFAKFAGMFFSVASLIVLWLLTKNLRLGFWYELFIVFYLVLVPGFLYYSVSGMETAFFMFLLLLSWLAMLLEIRKGRFLISRYDSSVLLFFVALTRVEGVIYSLAALFSLFIVRLVFIRFTLTNIKNTKHWQKKRKGFFSIMFSTLGVLKRKNKKLGNRNQKIGYLTKQLKQLLVEYLIRTIIFLVPFLIYLLWKYLYYGGIVSNTITAKTCQGFAFLIISLLKGVRYFSLYVISTISLLIFGIFYYIHYLKDYLKRSLKQDIQKQDTQHNTQHIEHMAGCSLVIYSLIIILSYILEGGDWMPYYRLLIPITPMLLLVSVLGFKNLGLFRINRFNKVSRSNNIATLIPVYLVFTLLVMAVIFANTLFIHGLVFTKMREKTNSYKLTQFIKTHSSPNDYMVFNDIGFIPYYSKVKIIDTLGLINPHIAHLKGCIIHADVSYMHFFIKKAKVDTDYVFSLKPRFILIQSSNNVSEEGVVKTQNYMQRLIVEHPSFRKYKLIYSIQDSGQYYNLFQLTNVSN